jgi:uncharacterized protein with PIN domain
MGYDAAAQVAQPLSDLYRRAYREQRIVVTRSRRIGASCLFRVVHVRSEQLEEQLSQLIRDLSLTMERSRTFSRCDRCNVEVPRIAKSQVKADVPPSVFERQQEFYRCPSCQRVYWAATHWQRASQFLERVWSTRSHA